MAEFPLSGHAETISRILSSVVPPRAYTYLSPFLPGLFFEGSIYFANPQFIQHPILSQSAHVGEYLKVFIALFLAFVVGHAFMLWVGIVYRILSVLYRVTRFLWRNFCHWPLHPILNWAMKPRTKPSWSRQPWMMHRLQRLSELVRDAVLDVDSRSEGVRKLWAILARHQFNERFGIKLALDQEEWNALYEASRIAQLITLSDHLLMLSTQALGWGGLVAIRFAPVLANKDYVIFNLFMIAIGLLYQWSLIRRANDSNVIGLLKVRALLRDYWLAVICPRIPLFRKVGIASGWPTTRELSGFWRCVERALNASASQE